MSATGYLKGPCSSCGQPIEFPHDGAGMTIACPHCNQTIILEEHNLPSSPKRTVTIVGSCVLLVLLVLGGYWWKHRNASSAPARITNQETNFNFAAAVNNEDFAVGPIAIQKAEGSGLVYAVGTVKNNSEHQRFGIRVHLDVLDSQENKIGTASDYMAVLEPRREWRFHALLTAPKAAKATLAAIDEDK